MLKLKLLEHSFLTENVLKVLSQSRITTILDFLNEDVEKICTVTKFSLPQVLAIRNYIFEKYSAPIINGVQLFEKCKTKKKRLSTGIESLDVILEGGLHRGYITELCGLANSGKTQLCIQLVINCVRSTENTVLYIDTKGDFSAIKVQKILESYGCSHKEMAEIMFKIKVVRVWVMEELVEMLQKIKKEAYAFKKLSLIIIDSLPCLMFQHLGDENKIGLALLNTFVNYCRFVCNKLELCVICVNIQTRWVDLDVSELEDEKVQFASTCRIPTYAEKLNRCLGKYWQQIPALVLSIENCLLFDSKEHENGFAKISITVLRSNSKIHGQCFVKIHSSCVSSEIK